MRKGLTCGEEPWRKVVGELRLLLPAHHAESGLKEPLNHDWEAYHRVEVSGCLLTIALRQDSQLVGYWTLFLVPCLHSKSVLSATTDMVFISPSSRPGGAFSLLYKTTQKALLARGVKLWFVGEKVRRPLGELFQRYGFEAEEVSYLKRLGG